MKSGDRLTLTIERPAAGGRMIARHADGVVLVSAAIPGEVVEGEVERVHRGVCWARTLRVLEPSPDRVEPGDWACGGNVFAHVAYPRQLELKREIILDAFRRIGRTEWRDPVDVMPSPVEGYRMRARLHVDDGHVGFFREGTHELCELEAGRQLLDDTIAAVRALASTLRGARGEVREIELTENRGADERAVHLILGFDDDPAALGAIPPASGLRGISCSTVPGQRPVVLWGQPDVTDVIDVPGGAQFKLTRHAHSFFQGNRHLLEPLVSAVLNEVPDGRALDLYAGVGLFAVALAARGRNDVVAIEGDRTSAADLKANAARVGALDARRQSVEDFLGGRHSSRFDTVIVDPPRTGMTKAAIEGALAMQPPRIVYVSCDVATLARDARLISSHGYQLNLVRAFDLFPNTAHVETLATFDALTPRARG